MDFLQLTQVVSETFVALRGAEPGTGNRVLAVLGPWLQKLAMRAPGKWLPIMAQNLQCDIPHGNGAPCANLAVTACALCGELTCLDHALFDAHGDAVCYPCVVVAKQARATRIGGSPPPRPRRRRPPDPEPEPGPFEDDLEDDDDAAVAAEAYQQCCEELGVSQGASDDEVRRAWRRAAAANHPDRNPGDAGARERFESVRKAYDFIISYRKRAAA